MGEVLSNKDFTFEEINSKSEIIFDIVIEKLYLQSIVNDKILVDEIWHNISSLIGKKYWIIPSNEIAIIKGFFLLTEMIFWHTPKK